MGGRDIYHSARGRFHECMYWLRNEDESGDLNEWVLKKKPAGTFLASEMVAENNQDQIVNGMFMFDQSTITLETDDDISDIGRGCVVLYNRKAWRVVNVQKQIHRKESEFASELDYKYYLQLKS